MLQQTLQSSGLFSTLQRILRKLTVPVPVRTEAPAEVVLSSMRRGIAENPAISLSPDGFAFRPKGLQRFPLEGRRLAKPRPGDQGKSVTVKAMGPVSVAVGSSRGGIEPNGWMVWGGFGAGGMRLTW